MVQFTEGNPVEGGAVVTAQSHVPHFPALPVSQIIPQPQVPQVYPEVASSQLYPEEAAQLYSDASAQLCADAAAQVYADPKCQLYPEATSQMFPQASSQLYPDSAPQLYPETTADAPSQFYTDPKSQLYPEPTQFFPEPTQFFPEPTQFFPEPTQFYPDTTSQLFTDTTSQMYSDLTSQLSSNPFTAPDQFVPSVDNFQYPAFSGTSTVDELTVPSAFTAFGPVDNLPTTRLDGGDISSQFVPEVCVDIAIPSEVVNNGSFTVVPVEDVQDYSLVDNALQKDTRADSLDSLSSGKGYASDASSDIYMNSDYTDTLNSVTSHTLLLEASKYSKESNSAPNTEETITAEPETAPLSDSFYTNDAFDSGVSLTSQYRSEHSLSSEVIPEEKNENEEDNENYNWITAYNSGNHEGEDSGATQDGGNVSDTEQVLLEAPDCVEDLVHQLAEQHPSDVVELHVEVLDEPVYQPLTEPIPEEEEGWMNSTESLHHYKLLKQGRTGTMFNLHERQSFLNLTAASVTSLGHVCQKALQYVRADMEFGSMMSLGLGDSMKHPSLLTLGKGGQPPSDLESLSGGLKKKIEPSVASGRHTRNLIYVSVLATILLVSINATRNLQSSLNQEGGVGITSLAISFAFYTLGSLISPIVVQKLGVRGSITFGLVLQLIYVAANLYPVMWLMAPASAGGGVSLAIIWNAVSTYIVLLARGESSYKEKLYERVSDKYFGIFCLIYQCNLVVGNLIASLILTFGDSAGSGSAAMLLNNTGLLNSSASNLTGSLASTQLLLAQNYFINNNETADRDVTGETLGLGSQSDFGLGTNVSSGAFDATKETHYHLCGSAFCHHFEINQDASTVSDYTKYLLFGIFMFLIGLAILIATFLLEPLCVRLSTVAAKPWQTVKRQVVSLARFSCNTKFLLLLPLLFYSNMQFSFVCSEVMMAFVTCPVGVWLVGYTMMCYGVSCGVASYLTQALVHRTGRAFFIGTASVINLGLLLFMRFWQPHPDSLVPLFVITGLFGFADGVWNVNANGLMGSVFPENYEEAFTGLRMAQGLGGALSMAYAPFLCMAVKIYIMLGATVAVFAGYLGAEFLIRRDRHRQLNILYEKEIV